MVLNVLFWNSSLFFAKKSNEEESDSSTALCVQEQMEAAYCLLMKVTVFGPSCGEDRTSCATRELQNRAACPVTEKPTHRAALRKAQEANLLLWCKGTVQPESECLPDVVAFFNPCKTSGASNRFRAAESSCSANSIDRWSGPVSLRPTWRIVSCSQGECIAGTMFHADHLCGAILKFIAATT